jgi:RNA polymerase sigma-70 factor (ECF subfamily)
MDEEDAEDAAQEVFVELWRCAERFDPSVASEATFVAMIARRRLIDRTRRKTRRPRESPLIEEVATSQSVSAPVGRSTEIGEEAMLARSVMETLSPEQQRVLRLTIIQGLTQEEAAVATGLPLGTVKTYARRGLMKIREAIAVSRRRLDLNAAS